MYYLSQFIYYTQVTADANIGCTNCQFGQKLDLNFSKSLGAVVFYAFFLFLFVLAKSMRSSVSVLINNILRLNCQ